MFRTGFRTMAFAALSLGLSPFAFSQEKLVGEWTGTLDAGNTSYRLAWHVKQAPGGKLTSTFDNLDEQLYGIKIKSLVLNGSAITATVDDMANVNGQPTPVKGELNGTLSGDGAQISGTWTQAEPAAPPMPVSFKRQAAAAAVPSAIASVPAAQVAGDWQGTLSVQGMQLRVRLHLRAAPDGRLTASIDSPDQGATGIPADSVTLTGPSLKFEISAIHGSYEGTVSPQASEIKGTWTQGQPMELNYTRAVAEKEPEPAAPTDIDGSWASSMTVAGKDLRMVFKLTNTTDGLKAQLQSPDQSQAWVPATSVIRTGSSVKIELKAFQLVYEGKLSSDLQSMEGTFTQAGNSIPLNLARAK